MTEHQYDTMLFLRLAGTKSGVHGRYIPSDVVTSATCFGGKVRFEADRIFVRNSQVTLARLFDVLPDTASS